MFNVIRADDFVCKAFWIKLHSSSLNFPFDSLSYEKEVYDNVKWAGWLSFTWIGRLHMDNEGVNFLSIFVSFVKRKYAEILEFP
jgi:hypothetical protein